jgi:hypothetical protein
MTSSFSTWVISFFLLACVGSLAAQPAATPAPESERGNPKSAYLRFWNLTPKGSAELRLVRSTGAKEDELLASAEPMNYYASYEPLAPGRYTLKVARAADPQTPLQTFDVLLRANVFVTFLARTSQAKTTVEMVDDTFDPAKALAGRLVIHQCFPEASVVVTNDARPDSLALTYTGERTVEDLPLRRIQVRLQATLPGGKKKLWSTEIDFRTAHRVTLLLLPDVYGRFRSRISIDGQLEP